MEEVEQLIYRHMIFQKLLTAQDEKVMGSGSPGCHQSGAWGHSISLCIQRSC